MPYHITGNLYKNSSTQISWQADTAIRSRLLLPTVPRVKVSETQRQYEKHNRGSNIFARKRPFFLLKSKKPLHTGVSTGCHSLICRSVCACVTFVVSTDCGSCTKPISTNPGYMDAGEYGLTRGTCFLACRVELDAVAGLVWISCCLLYTSDAADE